MLQNCTINSSTIIIKCHRNRIKVLGCDNNDKFSELFLKVTYPQFHVIMSSNAHVSGGNKRPKIKTICYKKI